MNIYSIKHLALKHLKDCRHANILTRGHRSVEISLKIKKNTHENQISWSPFSKPTYGVLQLCKTDHYFSASLSWSEQEVLSGIKV